MNKTVDNYIDPMVGGMISHEKTTEHGPDAERGYYVILKNTVWLRQDGSFGALPQLLGFDGEV